MNENEREILRAAGYARVSTDQDSQDGSFENQMEYLANLISTTPELSLVRIYGDHGISGRNMKERPELQELIRDCREKKIDLIYCKSLSRFARNMRETMLTIRELRACDVHFIFLKEGIDTRTMKGELVLSVMAAIAESESDSIGENLKMAHNRALMQGKVWHKPGYGYEWDSEKNWRIVPSEAERVRQIFRLAEEGKLIREIVEVLNEPTAPTTPTDGSVDGSTEVSKRNAAVEVLKTWTPQRVGTVLHNEIYVGDYLSNKTCIVTEKDGRKHVVKNNGLGDQVLIRDHHPAIVSRELFEKVARILYDRRPSYRRRQQPSADPATTTTH